MRIIFKDDVLVHINLKNETEEGSSEFAYSFIETSTLTLKFEELGYKQIVFEKLGHTPIEVGDLIEFLIDDILNYSTDIAIESFYRFLIDRFSSEDTQVNMY